MTPRLKQEYRQSERERNSTPHGIYNAARSAQSYGASGSREAAHLQPATIFVPPQRDGSQNPRHLLTSRFGRATGTTLPAWRYVRNSDDKQLLIFTDGACLSNGGGGVNIAQGGCGVVWGDALPDRPNACTMSFRLEQQGPTADNYPETSNRAELRAVDGALQMRHWPGEGFHSVVIAADSEYVVRGATEWCHKWLLNGWRFSKGTPVANRDLWESVLARVGTLQERGFRVLFWHIPRVLNARADEVAKRGAREPAQLRYTEKMLLELGKY